MKETSIAIAIAGSGSSRGNSTATSSGPKMGSRRIFTPQFKLQVLESYRNDSDCKGNQRATARKYNIHRRQIQKWLQCESNLRSSVANINQNSVKHQFHNISHHHHHDPQQQPLHISISATSVGGSHYSQHHSDQQQRQHLSLDQARHSVALSSIAALSPQSMDGVTSSTTASQGVLAAANLAAVVAAAAGSMAITSSPTLTAKAAAKITNVVSPLRPTAIVGGSGRTMSPPSILHHHLPHHHHHQHQHHSQYNLPYTHTPTVPMPVAVPILTQHISPHQPLHHYQYHNLSHHPHSAVTVAATALTQPQTQPSSFSPSVSLPATILSTEATNTANASISESAIMHSEKIRNIDKLHEVTASAIAAAAISTGNSYNLCHASENTGEDCQEYVFNKYNKKYETIQEQTLPVAPMDLSVGPRGTHKDEIQHNEFKGAMQSQIKCDSAYYCTENQNMLHVRSDGVVVDLTFRKRKVITSASINDEQPEKLSKLIVDSGDATVKIEVEENDDTPTHVQEDDEEVDVEVEDRTPPSKPIKLFKPYLLDEEENVQKNSAKEAFPENGVKQRDPIIWSHHPACMSPNSYDSRQDSSRGSNFQTPPLEKYSTFPFESPYFPISSQSYNHNILSPETATQGLSSPSSLRCPKGSPVSGYESSSSTYSDSFCKKEDNSTSSINRAFSIDLKLHPIYNDNVRLNESHIQKWLDQESVATSPATTSTPIALCV